MLTLQIWNVSDLAPVSDYHYAVYINREQIATGSVNGHTRDDGWAILVKKLAEAHIAVTTITTPDGRVIGTQLATVRELVACGDVKPRGRGTVTCVSPFDPNSGKPHVHKYVRIIPAAKPGVKR